ncbi:MAG: hypothetical protein IPH01_10780 [Elusimicrobia bacterium]|nr:hypothetical protein [Elusimicrobiota bacterium]
MKRAPPSACIGRPSKRLLIHETRFFRDEPVFGVVPFPLAPALPSGRAGQGPPGVWSAACSTGQEAYTLAFLLRATLSEETRFRLSATDVSEEASPGPRRLYSLFEIGRGLPDDIKNRFLPFTRMRR